MIFIMRGRWNKCSPQEKERFEMDKSVMEGLMDILDRGEEIEEISIKKFHKYHYQKKIYMILLTPEGETPPDDKESKKENYYVYPYGFPSGYYGAANWPPGLYSSYFDYPNVARRASLYGRWIYSPNLYPGPGRWVNYLGNYVYVGW